MQHFLLILLLFITTINCTAQRRSPSVSTEITVDWRQKDCFEKNKVKTLRVYEIADMRDTLHPEWRPKELNKYDKTGHQIFWRYYGDEYDSTVYFDRHVEYNEKQQAVKQYFSYEGIVNSGVILMGYDSLGRINYSAEVDTNGNIKVEPLASVEYNKDNKPVKTVYPSYRARTMGDWFQVQSYALFSYSASGKLTEVRRYIKHGDEKEFLGRKEVYSYYSNDTLKQKTVYSYFPDLGALRKTETTEFNVNGLLIKEIYYRLGIKEEVIEYTVERTYNRQNCEIETITTDIIAPEVLVTRKEVTEYRNACLKSKTLVYATITEIYPKPVLSSVLTYNYEFYP